MVGGALQAATQSSNFILVARVVTGLGMLDTHPMRRYSLPNSLRIGAGTGALTGIVPVYCSEVSSATHRGGFLGYVFIANCKLTRC